ncbi:hypothetical protein HPB52_005615 [Rhipicephalus sanguineus]|uniref:GH18 domain-containing protein n=1 Tax=Rhipicephalus sanguineus TaxID=34632 RepID=A0A9D4SZJ3_RHISA|nr:hypothetical protein HPB52_005615 [Rhipicephalus sanguineus]
MLSPKVQACVGTKARRRVVWNVAQPSRGPGHGSAAPEHADARCAQDPGHKSSVAAHLVENAGTALAAQTCAMGDSLTREMPIFLFSRDQTTHARNRPRTSNKWADFVNLMTYEFNTYHRLKPWVNHNSPLYPRSPALPYFRRLNVEFSAQLWVKMGLPKSKIMVGIPTFGLSWVLRNPDSWQIGSPATGRDMRNGGYVSFADVSRLQGKATQRKPTTLRAPPLRLHDYRAIPTPTGRRGGDVHLDQWTRPTLTRAIGAAASLPAAKFDRPVLRRRHTGCPARVRPPLNKERVGKALQQEQQRDIEHQPTPSPSSQEIAKQGALSYPPKDGVSTAACKAGDHFGSLATTSDETAFPPFESLQPAKQDSKSRATPGGTSGDKLGEGTSSALGLLPHPVPNLSVNSTDEAEFRRECAYPLRAEMEVKLRALDAGLRREIEAACATLRHEFRDMLNQVVSALRATPNNTVLPFHTLISSRAPPYPPICSSNLSETSCKCARRLPLH